MYLLARLRAVLARYGPTPGKAENRVRRALRALESYGLQPTFATPGRVVERNPAFFRELSDAGAELAVHGYDHADFRRLSREQAAWQFEQAIDAYARHGIPFEGFRCPYLSYTAEVRAILPDGAFRYSSNRAVAWSVVRPDPGGPVFTQLARNYRAVSSDDVVSTPSMDDGLVEIPASVPDDLQLYDGLDLGQAGLLRAWTEMLRATHSRGELFAPLLHPEAYDLLEGAVTGVLREALAQCPRIWLTQLRHVARWWRERDSFGVRSWQEDGDLCIALDCTERATVLARGWRWPATRRAWDDTWSVIDDRTVRVDHGTRPFVGVTGVDAGTARFLREQGYLVDDSEHAQRCSVTLDARMVDNLDSRLALVKHIESGRSPLLRYSRWPDEAKSALCFAGDLDALSLRDYAERLRPSVRARRG